MKLYLTTILASDGTGFIPFANVGSAQSAEDAVGISVSSLKEKRPTSNVVSVKTLEIGNEAIVVWAREVLGVDIDEVTK